MSGVDFSAPLRHEDWVLCVRLGVARVSVGLARLISHVFHDWLAKRRCLCILNARFFVTADRETVPISLDASPFHQIGWVEHYCKSRSCGLGF